MGSIEVATKVQQMQKLLREPSSWTKGVRARDASGAEVYERGDSAVQFCVLGALERVCDGNVFHRKDVYDILEATTPTIRALDDRGGEVVVHQYPHVYNDAPETAHEDIVEWLKRAFKMALPR